MSRRGGFGVTMARMPFSTFGCFTLMRPAIKTPNSLVFTVSMNVRRSLSMPDALLRSSMVPSPFTPLEFTTSGGMAPEATTFFRRLAGLVSEKRGIVLLRHHELDPLLPVLFSSPIFSSLNSRQSVHSAHFLQHSLQCCAHRCWVKTVTPFFF